MLIFSQNKIIILISMFIIKYMYIPPIFEKIKKVVFSIFFDG